MEINLGAQLRTLRQGGGKTQEDVARALGVTAQAVSRWEKGTCYPDMGMIPAIANFFGVTIDELFGYRSERSSRIGALAGRIREMNGRNSGKDVCVDECVRMAREGLTEYPGSEELMLCLASVLYNAGYVRHGEHHLTDDDGYDVYDVRRHRGYAEWREAVAIYERLLATLGEGEMRHQAVRELIQLYANLGEKEKAIAVARTAPPLSGCRERLRVQAFDGQEKAEACGEALLATVKACADLIIKNYIISSAHIDQQEAVRIVRRAIGIFDLICTDGNYGLCHSDLIGLHLFLSLRLWRAGDRDGAFDALDAALAHALALDAVCKREGARYTAPLLSSVGVKPESGTEPGWIAELPRDWPWWRMPGDGQAEEEMRNDPRWRAWAARAQSAGRAE